MKFQCLYGTIYDGNTFSVEADSFEDAFDKSKKEIGVEWDELRSFEIKLIVNPPGGQSSHPSRV